MIGTQAKGDFCGLPQSPACVYTCVCARVRTHTHARTHPPPTHPTGGSAGHSRANVATGPGEPGAGGRGAGVTGWEAGLRGSSRSHWSPGVGHHGLHGEGLAHSHRKGRSGGSFSTPGRGPPLSHHTFLHHLRVNELTLHPMF